MHIPPSQGPGEGVGLGWRLGGGRRHLSLISWEVLNPFLLTQPWGPASRCCQTSGMSSKAARRASTKAGVGLISHSGLSSSRGPSSPLPQMELQL